METALVLRSRRSAALYWARAGAVDRAAPGVVSAGVVSVVVEQAVAVKAVLASPVAATVAQVVAPARVPQALRTTMARSEWMVSRPRRPTPS